MSQFATDVLLVDPDRRVRNALRTLLAAAGFIVVGEVDSPAVARLIATRRPPRVAVVDPISDLNSGCALIKWLTTELGTAVVALTSDTRVRPAALAAGAEKVLTKGEDPEAILTALRQRPVPTSPLFSSPNSPPAGSQKGV